MCAHITIEQTDLIILRLNKSASNTQMVNSLLAFNGLLLIYMNISTQKKSTYFPK